MAIASRRAPFTQAKASMPARYRQRAFICGRISGRPAANSSAASSSVSASGSRRAWISAKATSSAEAKARYMPMPLNSRTEATVIRL